MLRGSVNNTTNPIASDANFKQVSLLLHGDGTNGAQNNTFLDSSTNNFTVTRNGNTTQGTNTPFSQAAGYWSNNFNGSSYFATPSTLTASGDFTWECWAYRTAAISTFQIISSFGGSTTWLGWNSSATLFYIGDNTAAVNSVISVPDTTNQWTHIAVVKSGSTMTLYWNGVSKGSGTSTGTFSFNNIGTYNAGSFIFGGYLSNVRFVNGTAVYTANFTPSTTPLTAITNTSLLTCQSNYFKDNSSNNFTLTATGTPSVQPFSPFAPTAAYSTSVNGGSEYFDGTGDYLTVATNAAFTYGVSDFTMECWVYLTTTGAIQYIIDQRNSGTANAVIPAIYVSASNVLTYFVSNAAQITGTTALKANAWYHVAVSRSTLSTKMFLNGVQEGSTYTDTNNYAASRVVVASNAATAGNYLTGYTSDVRLVNGTAVYTTTFTPPTAPLTAITNTSLLLSGTNAGIYDNAIKNDLETVGNAQVSTSVTKFGTGSMSFDGTGDWLTSPNTPNLQLGTGNFTIEGWVYLNAVGAARGFVSKGTSTTGWSVSANSSNQVVFSYASSSITSTGTLSVSTWYFVTVVRSGTGTNLTKIYIDGTNDGTGTVATDFNQTSIMYVGADRVAGSALNGYIDDLRITKGIARYTANFTPPTAAFPNQ